MEISSQELARSITGCDVARRLAACPFRGEVFLVGGAIREIALGRQPRDWDLALSEASDLARIEEIFGRRSFLLGKKPIQTHRLVSGETVLDITLLDGSIEKDLRRRDFTMNAVAFDIRRDRVIDPLYGLHDIEKGLIRYPGRETISSDPLRMLKAARHFAALEGFALDPELIDAMTSSRHLIGQTAPERIKYELDLIMVSEGVHRGMETLTRTGLIFEVVPELEALRLMDVEKNFSLETFGHTMLGFSFLHTRGGHYFTDKASAKDVGYALLFHDLGKAHTYSYDEARGLVHFFNHERRSQEIASAIMERLRFSTHEMKRISVLIEHHMRIFLISSAGATEKAVRRLIYRLGDLTPELIALTLCDMYGSSGGEENVSTRQVVQNCDSIMAAWHESKQEPLPRLLSGKDLLTTGFHQGPLLGKCLDTVRDRQVSGEMKTREEALQFAKEFLKKNRNTMTPLKEDPPDDP
ncbi:MAG: Multifunctional CCA protein [Syntrophorhabdus sp. PtaB.Bin184]|nr:MAG: Multifunctional CCA protein [Syntrophorhabdus sp. PtaB.Bin184]